VPDYIRQSKRQPLNADPSLLLNITSFLFDIVAAFNVAIVYRKSSKSTDFDRLEALSVKMYMQAFLPLMGGF
jgi:hypothetical protein